MTNDLVSSSKHNESILNSPAENSDLTNLRLNNCHWPFNGLNITVDGIATPCCIRMDPKFHKLENLMNLDNFEDLWNGEKYINLRKAHIHKDLNNNMCGNCPN